MQLNRWTIAFVFAAIVALPFTPVQAQTAVNYRFLEVVDTAGKPLAAATVETGLAAPLKTDEKGAVPALPVYSGDFNTRSLKVSKPGYLTYEGGELLTPTARDEHLLRGEDPKHDPKLRIKIELLKDPVTPAEQQALAVAQHKRQLLWAARQGDDAAVRRLLRTGVDANAADVDGIPAILWAASSGKVAVIKELLAADADVRSKDKPGRKALLYYLYYTTKDEDDVELIRALIKAGADVNAADYSGTTVLSLASKSTNPEILKLVKKAGAIR
jgi:hypothetical protein